MEVRVWLGYDLGVKGDYPGLYAFLDDHDAIECGESFCSFLFECSDRDNLKPELLAAIESAVQLAPTDRLYVIYRRNDNLTSGSFLWGRRKANPWEGYGSKRENTEESDPE